MTPTVVISRRGADRVRAGHPWIYQSDILEAEAESGDLVRVREERRRGLGWGLWSSLSQIALRMMVVGSAGSAGSRVRRVPGEMRSTSARCSRAVCVRRSTTAPRLRSTAPRAASCTAKPIGCRRSSSTSTAMRAASTSCCRRSARAMDRRAGLIVELLHEIVRPRGVLARNDPKVRRLEGLEERIDVLAGEIPETVAVREGDVTFRADLRHGQKTGLFLDQRENHVVAAQLRGRTRARRVHLQRRLRAASGAPVPVGRLRSTRRRRPWR